MLALGLLSFQLSAASVQLNSGNSTSGVTATAPGPGSFVAADYFYSPATTASSITFGVDITGGNVLVKNILLTDSSFSDLAVINVSVGNLSFNFTASQFANIWSAGPVLVNQGQYLITATLAQPITGNGQINLQVNSGVSQVPVPAAVWLFGSALMGLAGVSRKKGVKAAA